jgi:hypothetical protein
VGTVIRVSAGNCEKQMKYRTRLETKNLQLTFVDGLRIQRCASESSEISIFCKVS